MDLVVQLSYRKLKDLPTEVMAGIVRIEHTQARLPVQRRAQVAAKGRSSSARRYEEGEGVSVCGFKESDISVIDWIPCCTWACHFRVYLNSSNERQGSFSVLISQLSFSPSMTLARTHTTCCIEDCEPRCSCSLPSGEA